MSIQSFSIPSGSYARDLLEKLHWFYLTNMNLCTHSFFPCMVPTCLTKVSYYTINYFHVIANLPKETLFVIQ